MHVRELIADCRQDLRYAFRTLRRDAAFTGFVVAIVALGIGVSVTVFSVARGLLLRPLPFTNPSQLVWVQNGDKPGLSDQTAQVNPYLSLEKENRSFSEVAAYFAFYGAGDEKLQIGDEAMRLSAVPVTQNFFPLLGVKPILGRGFTAAEAVWNGPRVVLISYPLWQNRFGSDRNVVGRVVPVNGTSTTIIGVLPQSFDFGSIFAPGARLDLFVPFPLTPETNRWGNTLSIVARLKPGVSVAAANAELRTLSPRIMREDANANYFSATAMSLRDHVSGPTRAGVLVLSLAVIVVMLIVCANLSNLLLARATTREKEMAIRVALGAGRRRLIRQMLTESVLLCACGAALGVVLAVLGTHAIARMDAVALPLLSSVTVDPAALLFAAALTTAAGIAFGLAPALQLSRIPVHDALRASGRSATDGKRGQWIRQSLVVGEIALACVLVVSAGLLARSFLKVLDVKLGFRPEQVVALRVDPDENEVRSDTQAVAYADEVLALSRHVPGVTSAAIVDGLPFGSNRSWGIMPGGQEYVKGRWQSAFIRVATDGLVPTMGMTIIQGRDLSPQDIASAERVVVINRTAAAQLWPGQSAVGKLLRVGDTDCRVVGIVADVKHLTLETGAGNEVYVSLRQGFGYSSLTLIVRTPVEPAAIARTLRTALAPVARNLAINEVQTLESAVNRAMSPRRFFTLLLGGFSAFALTLALLGIYGVISYTVTHRTREIGIRIALGASARQVQRMVIRETLVLTAGGIAIGMLGAVTAARTLGGFLFGVTSTDTATYAGMIVVVVTVAIASGYLPARRASRVDPTVALREG